MALASSVHAELVATCFHTVNEQDALIVQLGDIQRLSVMTQQNLLRLSG